MYIPDMGLYMYSTVVYATTVAETDGRNGWIGLYGWFDLVSLDATPLAPGATLHKDICYIRPSIGVTNSEEKTARNIPVRGRLKISAYYFLTKEDWLKNKAEQDGHYPNFQDGLGDVSKTNPAAATIETVIPCYGVGCQPGCDVPPVVLDGEQTFLFNFKFDQPGWKARGEAINQVLARKSSACSEANPASNR
ncbi:MAG TPA: hypothetical protein VLX32_05700 [Candidatus Acidoferrum sp.]|nr:hypothetical protein [Candidatus Acidoferrum sp.]